MTTRTVRTLARIAGCLALVAVAPPASGQEAGLTRRDAIERAVRNNPGLASALLDARRAAANERAEQDLYPLVLDAGLSGSRTTTPGITSGGYAFSTGNELALSVGLGKSFATGTSLTLDLSGTLDNREGGASSTSLLSAAGNTYGITGRLTLNQPLLRGFGTRVGESSLRQARLARVAGQRKAERVASELLRDVLDAWWELAYATESLAILEDARKLAERQLAEVETRIARGTLAEVEALSFRTALASREEDLAAARDSLRRQGLELLRLLGTTDAPVDGVVAAGAEPDKVDVAPVPADLEDLALAASRSLREQEAQVAVARDQALTAGETSRPRLDLSAWVQGQGLGDESPGPAFSQIGKAQAGGAFVGLAFEMPVTGSRAASQRAAAELAVQSAEQSLLAAKQQVLTQALSLKSQRDAADQKLALSLRTEERARAQAEAERRRYETGTAISLTVQQAEDAWRQARLRVVRTRVDRIQAGLAIDHLTGLLLDRYRDVLGTELTGK